MSDRSKNHSPQGSLTHALKLVGEGYRVFPCRPFSKIPATRNGFHDATAETATIERWFGDNDSYNLGVPMGRQPDGTCLLAVDVDPKNGGDQAWNELTAEHGSPLAPRHDTPSGGFHLFFTTPEPVPNGILAPGIDLRGEGGYVVVPPSQLVDDQGELIAYSSTKSTALALNRAIPCPPWLWERVLRPPATEIEATRRRHPSAQPLLALSDSVADLARSGWIWLDELEADSWVLVRTNGADTQWTRPGKDPREGTSATLHGDGGPFVVWSTSLPEGGVPTRDHVGRSYSPWDYIVTFRAGGDTKVAAALVRGPAIVGPQRAVPEPDSPGGAGTPLASDNGSLPKLPTDFWQARPKLAHIAQAGQATMTNPLAVLLHMLVRSSALIPPCYVLPGWGDSEVATATLDLMGCIVAETGVNKSRTVRTVRRLLPDPAQAVPEHERAVLLEVPPGSGEGLIDTFFEEAMIDDPATKSGKRTVWKVSHQGVHALVAEGNAFVTIGERKGVTIVETMNQAWSGEGLGQANTKRDGRRRIIEASRVRFSAIINIQSSMAWKLFDEKLTVVGFAGRLIYAPATYPEATRFGPEWPGPLQLPSWNAYDPVLAPQILTYDPQLMDLVGERLEAAAQGRGPGGRRSQYLVTACKVAAILAMWEERRHVQWDDWLLAEQIMNASDEMLASLEALRRTVRSEQDRAAAVARGNYESIVESVKERQGVASMAETIHRHIRRDGGHAVGQLRKKVAKSELRHRFDAALDLAVSNGWVVVNDGRVELA